MALPTLTKTWQYSVNNVITSSGADQTDYRNLLFGIKQAMIGFASNPWTVVGSCNSTVAGMDAVDRWSSAANLVWNTTSLARSWIVLKQTGMGTNFQLLICLGATTNASEQIAEVYFSPNAGFTGGSTTARPTAADEQGLLIGNSSGQWMSAFTSTFSCVYHVLQSTDGECTRVVICYQGRTQALWILDKIQNPVTGFTYPVACAMQAATNTTSAEVATYAVFNDTAGNPSAPAGGLMGYHSGGMGLYMTSEGYVADMVGQKLTTAPNDISGDWPMCPIGVASETVGKRGRHGNLADIWWGVNVLPVGSTYPSDGTRQFAQFRDLILPWNGTVVRIF